MSCDFAHDFCSPDGTYSKCAGINRQISVLSCAQNLSTTNVLPNVRDLKSAGGYCQISVLRRAQNYSITNILSNVRDVKHAGVNCQISVLSCAQNLSTANVSPDVRDGNGHLDHCNFVVFRSQSISYRTHSCHNIVSTASSFVQIGVYSTIFLASFLRYILLCCIHFQEPFLSLLVYQICDIVNIADVFDKSLLRTLWNIVVHNSVTAPVIPFPWHLQIGGGGTRKGLAWSSIERFVNSFPCSFNTCRKVLYVDHVKPECLQLFPAEKYVYARLPLANLVDLVPLANARSIVALHGIAPGSRCNAAILKSCVAEYSCSECPGYVMVFSVVEDAAIKSVERTVRYRAKTNLKSNQQLEMKPEVNARFPPEPASKDFELCIIRNACKRMDPNHFEEVGCAVCGELKPRSDSSRLKSVKNILGILEAPGVTRVERKTDKCPIKEYRGPVLDYSCGSVCNGCRGDLRKGKVPKLALSKNLWLGSVPDVLKNLTFVEKILVEKVRHTCAFVKVASGMRKMKANIVAFESPIQKIYNILPPSADGRTSKMFRHSPSWRVTWRGNVANAGESGEGKNLYL